MPDEHPPLLVHPGLTLTVYRLTADGRRRVLRSIRFHPSGNAAPLDVVTGWPPCRCPRHRAK